MKYFITLVFIVSAINVTAQKDEEGSVTDITKITLLNPGFSYEKALGQFQTLYVQAFMNTSATRSEGVYGSETKYYFDPALTAQFRFYYNYNRRKERRLRTELNNLNYITPLYQVFFSKAPIESISIKPEKRRAIHFVGAAWGIQRNYPKRFSLDLGLGLGVLFAKNTTIDWNTGDFKTANKAMPYPYAQLNIGFWLNKRAE